MTILDLWYLIAKSSKNFTGGKENGSAIARLCMSKPCPLPLAEPGQLTIYPYTKLLNVYSF